MADNSSYQELARRYGFAPKLESASRLTQLVARQDSDVDEIVKVIDKDPALRGGGSAERFADASDAYRALAFLGPMQPARKY